MTNVTFNDTLNPELKPITENEAMRRSIDYSRFVNISINPSNIEGYVYNNIDNVSEFNISVDEGISDYSITFIGINSLNPETGEPEEYDYEMLREIKSDENGFFNTSGLLPGYYQLTVTDVNDFLIENTIIPIYEGNNSYDILNPKPGAIEGTVYFDENNNGQFDSNEELNNVNLELQYSVTGPMRIIDTKISDSSGRFSFTSLVIS